MEINQIINAAMLEEINISFLSSFYSITASVFSAMMIRIFYIKYGRSMNNREYFGNIFILLSVTTCTVIIIVKYSLALSLGLVGALSIVRFRAAIKEPEELVYLFLTIALGLSFGANQFAVGFMLLVGAILIIILTGKFYKKSTITSHTGLVVIISGSSDLVMKFRDEELELITSLARSVRLKELSYEDNGGRLTLQLSLDEETESVINRLEVSAKKLSLNLNILSDVSVPA